MPCCTSKISVPNLELYQTGYQQALKDFAITDLLQHLNTYSEAIQINLTAPEAETFAVILIQALIVNGDVTAYLNAIRSSSSDTFASLSKFHLPPTTTDLPNNFPDVEMPRFLYGDRLCWTTHSETTDWGIVIGRFYSFAPHCCRWRWCYLIWLDSDSPSAAWVRADIAWEDDLEPLETEPVL